MLKLSTDESEDDRRMEALAIMSRLASVVPADIVRQHFVAQVCLRGANVFV